MTTDKFQNQYRIPSARAVWHDYGGGAYFVTVCTKNKVHSLGEIHSAVVELSPVGQYLSDNLEHASVHYPYIEIPLFVVMPNHWHAIVFVDGDKTPYPRRITDDGETCGDGELHDCRDVARRVLNTAHRVSNDDVQTGRAPSLQRKTDDYKPWLSVAIGGIKSAVTKYARGNGFDFAWQTRFHDRIIRDADTMTAWRNTLKTIPRRGKTIVLTMMKNNAHISPDGKRIINKL